MEQREAKYVSSLYGGFWNFDIRDFCYMTNPYFPPQQLLDGLGLRLKELVKSYPSTNWYLSSLVAKPLGLTHEQVVIGNGASELISVVTSLFVDRLAVPAPTFDEFVNRARIQGKGVAQFQLAGDFELDVPAFIRHVQDSHANAALLIRPNNPTGTLISKTELRQLLSSLRQLDLILVDESFIEFVDQDADPSALDMISEFPNLMIMKSLSKNYGIPGLRIGYVASANTERIAQIRQHLPIWSINSLAQYFLEEMGSYQQEFAASCVQVRYASQSLFRGLQSVPYLQPYPTQGNFVLCRLAPGHASAELTAHLFDEFKILINDCGGKHGLDGRFVRVASRTTEENAQFVQDLIEAASRVQQRVQR